MLGHLIAKTTDYECGNVGGFKRKIRLLEVLAELHKQLEHLMDGACYSSPGHRNVDFRSTPGFGLRLDTSQFLDLIDTEWEVVADIFRQYGWRVEREQYTLTLS